MREPHGVSLFCDDVREEKDGKRTYVGVHGQVLNIETTKPAVLPRLCIVSHIVLPADFDFRTFRHELVRRQGDKEETLGQSVHDAPPRPAAPRSAVASIKAILGMEFTPFEITEECRLLVRAVFDDLTIPLGTLAIRFAAPSPDQPQTPNPPAA